MAQPSAQPARPKGKKTATNRLLALSGAAVLAVYGAGYVRTEAPAHQAAAAAAVFSHPGSTPGLSGSAHAAVSTPAPSSAGSAPAVATTTTLAYRDGSYTATGYGFHGPVAVTVVIKSGKIVSANVTSCGTTYSCSYITPLVQQVVSVQGPPTDYVSGATASSDAYYQAVTSALGQAKVTVSGAGAAAPAAQTGGTVPTTPGAQTAPTAPPGPGGLGSAIAGGPGGRRGGFRHRGDRGFEGGFDR